MSSRFTQGAWRRPDRELARDKEAFIAAAFAQQTQRAGGLTPDARVVPREIEEGGLHLYNATREAQPEKQMAPPQMKRRAIETVSRDAFVYDLPWLALWESNALLANFEKPNLDPTARYPVLSTSEFFMNNRASIVAASSVAASIKARDLQRVQLVPSAVDPLRLSIIMTPPADQDAPYLVVYGDINNPTAPLVGKVGVYEVAAFQLRSDHEYEFFAGLHASTTQPVLDGQRNVQRFTYRVPNVLKWSPHA